MVDMINFKKKDLAILRLVWSYSTSSFSEQRMRTKLDALLSDLELEQSTEREATEERENHAWHNLAATLNFAFGRQAQWHEMVHAREEISREELLDRNKLSMKANLMIHGYTPSADDELDLLRTIHVKPASGPDESWKNLPQILPTVDLKQLKSMSELCSELGVADPKGLRVLLQDEEKGRNFLVSNQAQLRQRVERTFAMYLTGLKDMEANLVGEVQQAFLAKLQPDQRIAYIMRPCISRETFSRSLIQLAEQAMRGTIAVAIEEDLVRGRLQRFIVETLKDRRDRKLAYALKVVDGKATYRLRSSRFFAWKICVAEKIRVNKAIKLMLSVSLTQNIALIRRYCAIWNRPLHSRRSAIQRQALFHEADLAYLQLTLYEDEERERNFNLISWENSRGSMTDAFLSQRDALRMTLLRGRAVALREVSHATHLRSRMLTLYRYVVRKTQLQRALWLGETNTLVTLQRYFRKFRQFPTVSRVHAAERRAAVSSYTREVESLSLNLQESYGRSICNAEVDLWTRHVWEAHGAVVSAYCKDLQVRALATLHRRCVRFHTEMRFSKWLRFVVERSQTAAVSALWNSKNRKLHASSAFARWLQWLASRQTLLRQFLRRRVVVDEVTTMEESEARHRLVLQRSEGRLRCIVARRGPRQMNVRQSDIDRLRYQNRVHMLSRAFAPWLKWLSRRVDRRKQRDAVMAMRAEAQRRTITRFENRWRDFVDRSKILRLVATQIMSCIASEARDRHSVIAAEAEDREASAAMLSRDEALAAYRRRQEVSEELKSRTTLRHTHLRFAAWHRRTTRRSRKRLLAQQVNEQGLAVNMRYYFKRLAAWRRWCQGSRRTQHLLGRVQKHLALKYFRRLYPAAVRQAKVCRARNALAQAQAAARLLEAAPSSAAAAPSATGRSLPKTFLPPLLRQRSFM